MRLAFSYANLAFSYADRVFSYADLAPPFCHNAYLTSLYAGPKYSPAITECFFLILPMALAVPHLCLARSSQDQKDPPNNFP